MNYLLVYLAAHHIAVSRTDAHHAVPHGQDALRGTKLLSAANSFELGTPGGFQITSAVCRYTENPQIRVGAKKPPLSPQETHCLLASICNTSQNKEQERCSQGWSQPLFSEIRLGELEVLSLEKKQLWGDLEAHFSA